ncbi:hypothetical protein ACOSQ4_003025 [Xanthoceras sorbifolium]
MTNLNLARRGVGLDSRCPFGCGKAEPSLHVACGCKLLKPFRVASGIFAGLAVPSLSRRVLGCFDIAPGQLMPNGWRLLLSVEVFNEQRGFPFSLGNFLHTFYMKSHEDEPGCYLISARPHCPHLITDLTTNDRGWKDMYFFVWGKLVTGSYEDNRHLEKAVDRREPTIESFVGMPSSTMKTHKLSSHTLEAYSIILHILNKNRKFKSAESILKGKLENTVQVFKEMECMGLSPTVASYNTLIAGHCNKGLLSLAVKLKNSMGKDGVQPNVITFNTLIYGFCKERKFYEANRMFSEMKAINVAPNIVTYNTLINGFSQTGNCEMGGRLYKRWKNFEHTFQLYKTMIKSGCHPNKHTFEMLMSTFCENEDFDGILSEICSGLCRCGNDQLAIKLLNEMEIKRLLPEGFDKARTNNSKLENYDKEVGNNP